MTLNSQIDDDGDHRQGKQDEEVSYLDDHAFEMAAPFHLRPGYQTDGLSKVSVQACAGDNGHHLTLLDDSIGIGFLASLSVHRQGFTGQGGLVYLQKITPSQQLDIGGNDISNFNFGSSPD